MAVFNNFATLSYNGGTTNSNTVTGEILDTLSSTKIAVMDDYTAKDDATYVISLVNSSTAPLTDVTITDDLGGYLYGTTTVYPLAYTQGSVRLYINGVLQPAPAVTAGPPLVFSGISIPAGGNTLIIYEARVNDYADIGITGTITNTATVTSAVGDPDTVNITTSTTITVESSVLLSITKSLTPSTIPENGRLTYTFVIQNTGNTEAIATDNVTVTDLFDPVLNPISVTYNGTGWTAGTQYTYDPTTGQFATVPGRITVPAATYTQDPISGLWTMEPGVSILTVTGIV